MRVSLSGLAVLAPGLRNWGEASRILAGAEPYSHDPCTPPAPAGLPATERRRTTLAIRLAVAVADAALREAGQDPTGIEAVFASGNGDGAVVGAILEALAGTERFVSPTQFHNSVHNAPAAYWSIGAACMAASTSLGGYDGAFASGLLQAAAKTFLRRRPVLLCASDAPMPPPLDAARPTPGPFAVAMLLDAETNPRAVAWLTLRCRPGNVGVPTRLRLVELQALHGRNPAARALPLLELLARREAGTIRLEGVGNSHLEVEVNPC